MSGPKCMAQHLSHSENCQEGGPLQGPVLSDHGKIYKKNVILIFCLGLK